MWGSFYTLILRCKHLDIIKYIDLFQQTKVMITILPNPLNTIFSPSSCNEFIFPPKAARYSHIYQIGNLIYSNWESVLHWEELQTLLFPNDTSLRIQKGEINNSEDLASENRREEGGEGENVFAEACN